MKKILYFSNSKFPLAGLAGAIHAGSLPLGREPEASEIWGLQSLNIERCDEGKILSLGSDERGNEIYALSVKGERGMTHRLVESFLEIYGIPEDGFRLVDTGMKDNLYMLAGRALFCFRFLLPVARFFAYAGIKKSYAGLSRLVSDVRCGTANLP
ncbi:MAG TPA: DUF3189 family protein [Bacillota bacterium]|nr:DUF3189 family protein [Bacillota bacterium]